MAMSFMKVKQMILSHVINALVWTEKDTSASHYISAHIGESGCPSSFPVGGGHHFSGVLDTDNKTCERLILFKGRASDVELKKINNALNPSCLSSCCLVSAIAFRKTVLCQGYVLAFNKTIILCYLGLHSYCWLVQFLFQV